MSATFEEAIQPLLNAHATLEADIEEREAELAQLKDRRNRLRTAVRALAPERLPVARKNGKLPPQATSYSDAALQYVSDFLRAHITGEFGSRNVLEHDEYAGVGGSTLPSILRALHEAGVIRLVRTGKGSSRFYEVIR